MKYTKNSGTCMIGRPIINLRILVRSWRMVNIPTLHLSGSGESFHLAGPRLGSSFAEFYVRMCERATALLKGSEMASLVLVDTI